MITAALKKSAVHAVVNSSRLNTPAGRLQSRAWVRLDGSGNPLTTTYAYDDTGSLTNFLYSDGTPSVGNTYDRLGRLSTAQWTNIIGTMADQEKSLSLCGGKEPSFDAACKCCHKSPYSTK